MQNLQITESRLSEILASWGLRLKEVHDNAPLAGSPERTLFRVLVEDILGNLYVLEKIPAKLLSHKTKIAETLQFLCCQGIPGVHPYLPSIQNQAFIVKNADDFWQLAPFIPGTALNRPDYIYEGPRGEALAGFLIALREKAGALPFFDPADIFSIKNFILNLSERIKMHNPELTGGISAPLDTLRQEFLPMHDQFPTAFCHGDYHPLNIIWEEARVNGVIDWEFLGYKPEIYDLANLIGCIGMEHPSGLKADMTLRAVDSLKKAPIFSDLSWRLLPEFVLALRFAWLSEWLRKKDEEMVHLEITYLNLLKDSLSDLKRIWNI